MQNLLLPELRFRASFTSVIVRNDTLKTEVEGNRTPPGDFSAATTGLKPATVTRSAYTSGVGRGHHSRKNVGRKPSLKGCTGSPCEWLVNVIFRAAIGERIGERHASACGHKTSYRRAYAQWHSISHSRPHSPSEAGRKTRPLADRKSVV